MMSPEATPQDVTIDLREPRIPETHESLWESAHLTALENLLELATAAQHIAEHNPEYWWTDLDDAASHSLARTSEIITSAVTIGMEQYLRRAPGINEADIADRITYDRLFDSSRYGAEKGHLSLLDALSHVANMDFHRLHDKDFRPDAMALEYYRNVYVDFRIAGAGVLFEYLSPELGAPGTPLPDEFSPRLAQLRPEVVQSFASRNFLAQAIADEKRRVLTGVDTTFMRFWFYLNRQRYIMRELEPSSQVLL